MADAAALKLIQPWALTSVVAAAKLIIVSIFFMIFPG